MISRTLFLPESSLYIIVSRHIAAESPTGLKADEHSDAGLVCLRLIDNYEHIRGVNDVLRKIIQMTV